ncbi:MAG: hypothetical protein H6799_00425 [Candidatus Nomurabacteria bacterium]|nr:MAG: hypothetical protein H6799_00425 [Candidatus Nomurabacteria bacterium]
MDRPKSTTDRLKQIMPFGVGSAPISPADGEIAALMASQGILPIELTDGHEASFGPVGTDAVEQLIISELGDVASHPPIVPGSNVVSMFGSLGEDK